ncbi:MAG: EamA family transporter [Spirochaeta sp.]|jgi:undecaprenyl phosphate-alpha-L-ara4N flippase subunit ArnE|nr:EamA family transporter [Spirochaeta sp.]
MIFVFIAVGAQALSLILAKQASFAEAGIDRYLSLWYLGSLTALGIQAIVWQQALRRLALSVAYPMMSLVFVLLPILGWLVFDERISVLQMIGTVFILVGTIEIDRESRI